MTYQVVDDQGVGLDAHFDVDGSSIVFHSRGGSKERGQVNGDYGRALRLLLARVQHANLSLSDAWVDSANVQHLSLNDRRIVQLEAVPHDPARQFTMLSSLMKSVGKDTQALTKGGNTTKRIRLRFEGAATSQLVAITKGRKVERDFRSRERLPANLMKQVRPDHIYSAVQRLRAGEQVLGFGPSTDYDLVVNGERLPPKAVFGLAATDALGFAVGPKHFSGGRHSTCFRMLEAAGYAIRPKDGAAALDQDRPRDASKKTVTVPPQSEDGEWIEGNQRRVVHLQRERAAGLSNAKKAAFRAEHGRLFCERCQMDPVEVYGAEVGEACIEVHHAKPVSEMEEGHVTRLEDVMCLCASCHRVLHRELKLLDERGSQARS